MLLPECQSGPGTPPNSTDLPLRSSESTDAGCDPNFGKGASRAGKPERPSSVPRSCGRSPRKPPRPSGQNSFTRGVESGAHELRANAFGGRVGAVVTTSDTIGTAVRRGLSFPAQK
jgi:hypothetical protein